MAINHDFSYGSQRGHLHSLHDLDFLKVLWCGWVKIQGAKNKCLQRTQQKLHCLVLYDQVFKVAFIIFAIVMSLFRFNGENTILTSLKAQEEPVG